MDKKREGRFPRLLPFPEELNCELCCIPKSYLSSARPGWSLGPDFTVPLASTARPGSLCFLGFALTVPSSTARPYCFGLFALTVASSIARPAVLGLLGAVTVPSSIARPAVLGLLGAVTLPSSIARPAVLGLFG